MRIYSIRGSHVTDFEGSILCVAEKGEFTRSICVSDYYVLWNITGSEDLQDPYVSIIRPYDGEIINNYTIVVSWDVYDDTGIANILLRLDSREWIDVSGLTSYVFYNVYEGEHVVYLNVTDLTGRTSVDSVSFTVVPPFTLSVYRADNNSLIRRSWVIVEYNTTGTVDRVVIYANGSEKFSTTTMLNGSVNITGLCSGFWIIDVVAYGSGAHVSRSIYVHIDVDPPSINVLAPENNTFFAANASILIVHVEIEYWDNYGVDRVEYNLNGSGWVVMNDVEIDLMIHVDGMYVLCFRIYDIAGNFNETKVVFIVDFPASFTVNFDYNNVWINSPNISFSWSSTHIDRVYLYINGELRDVLDSNGVLTLTLGEGIWNITLVAVGYNDRIVRTLWAKIDLTPPSVEIVSPVNNTVIYAVGNYTEVEIEVSVGDNVGVERILLTYRNTTFEIGETATIILPVGEHTIYITAVDKAGNEKTVALHITVKQHVEEEGEEGYN